MYSEKIDTIRQALFAYNDDLRGIAKAIIKDCLNINQAQGATSINVAYYTDGEILGYDFLGIDGNGYGHALFIRDIECRSNIDNPVFTMIDEDGDEFERRILDDFDTTELVLLVTMLNDLLYVAKKDNYIRHTI